MQCRRVYEWRIWMKYMNEVYEWSIWMKYMNEVYEWSIWMKYMNEVYEWSIWMKYMNVLDESAALDWIWNVEWRQMKLPFFFDFLSGIFIKRKSKNNVKSIVHCYSFQILYLYTVRFVISKLSNIAATTTIATMKLSWLQNFCWFSMAPSHFLIKWFMHHVRRVA